jgi:glutathione S-transferase
VPSTSKWSSTREPDATRLYTYWRSSTSYRVRIALALKGLMAEHPDAGSCVHGDMPTLADLCLVPQMYSARRFNIDLGPYPTLVRIDAHCRKLDAFAAAAPEAQPDADPAPK